MFLLHYKRTTNRPHTISPPLGNAVDVFVLSSNTNNLKPTREIENRLKSQHFRLSALKKFGIEE